MNRTFRSSCLAFTIYGASAANVSAAQLPKEVQADIDENVKACSGRVVQENGFVTLRRVRGVGEKLYFLDYLHLRCAEAGASTAAFWCGSIGCQGTVFVKIGQKYDKTEITGEPTFEIKRGRPYMTFFEKNRGKAEPVTLLWDGHRFR